MKAFCTYHAAVASRLTDEPSEEVCKYLCLETELISRGAVTPVDPEDEDEDEIALTVAEDREREERMARRGKHTKSRRDKALMPHGLVQLHESIETSTQHVRGAISLGSRVRICVAL